MAYPLAKVKVLASQCRVRLIKSAPETAKKDFGWGVEKVAKSIGRLKGQHLQHSEPDRAAPFGVEMNYYRAPNLMEGFDVYMHFSVIDDWIVVSSFKQL